jgi:uncharacterized repeat protein (TIGR02543 family)
MKYPRFASLFLATLLQVVPLARQWVATLPSLPGVAVVFRWGVGATAALGAFDAVSGASTVITSPTTATGTNAVAFKYRITTGPEVANTFTAVPLPPNLVCATNTGYITGIPNTNGVFVVRLTASDNSRPDRTVSTNLTLTIVPAVTLTPPTITTQPASQSVAAGANVTFSVVAGGSAPLRYQWRFNAGSIAGATNASYTINNVQTNQAGNYSVLVSNAAGNVTSANATLTVQPPAVAPSITTQPQSQTIIAGQTATFTVAATGTTPLAYQWLFNSASITGASSSSFNATQAGNYQAVVANSAGSVTSLVANLTVLVPPTIVTQPQSQSIVAGNAATFTVTATGTVPLSYQWLLNGATLAGMTSASLVTTQAGGYSVVVSNVAGMVTSATATLAVLAAPVAPTITTQPQSQTVPAGTSATFTVVASGTQPLSYQWRLNGTSIAGAASPSLVTTQAGNYSVIVSNVAGTATSTTATLTVQSAVAPTISTQPASLTIMEGGTATFTVVANGTAPLSYQWRRDGVAVPGATSATYSWGNCQTNQAGQYSVVVSNAAGSVTSATATLTVNPATAVFTLTVTGQGSVSPNLNGQNLVIGQTYTLTAIPNDGYVFTGWSGSESGTDPAMSFVMRVGAALEANFVPTTSSVAAGIYAGLFYESGGAAYPRAGLLTLHAADNGKFKGKLQIGASRFGFAQRFDQTGHATAKATCPGQMPLTVDLRPDAASGEIVAGTVGSGIWVADSIADRAAGSGGLAGTYQVALPDTSGNASNSFATAVVDARGVLKLKGIFVTGARVRQRVPVAKDGTWPLYLPTRGGALIGWMKLEDAASGTVAGDVLWLPASP